MLRKIVRVPVQILAIIAVAIATIMQWVASLMLVAYYKTAGIKGDDCDRAMNAVLSPIQWVKMKIGS